MRERCWRCGVGVGEFEGFEAGEDEKDSERGELGGGVGVGVGEAERVGGEDERRRASIFLVAEMCLARLSGTGRSDSRRWSEY